MIRKNYTIKQKQEFLKNLIDSNESITIFSKRNKIPFKTLEKWYTNRKELLSIKNNTKKRKCRNSLIPEYLEIKLIKWFSDMRRGGIPITDNILKIKMEKIIEDEGIIIKCNFTNGWLDKFKRRYNICKHKASSKILNKNDCDIDIIKTFVKSVNIKIESNNYEYVVNIDETPLYYDYPINYTLDIKGTRRTYVKNTGRSKEKVSIILSVDLFNNLKLKPLIIFKGISKRCISKFPKSDYYNLTFQKNSWCTHDIFIMFLSYFPKNKKILIICDNFKSHISNKVSIFLKKEYPLIDLLFLPPNTTSILQPLDIGINKSFKSFIKNQYIEWLYNNFELTNEIPKFKKYERSILLLKWISLSWNKINSDLIIKSFDFCGYLIPMLEKYKWEEFYNLN